MSIQIPPGTDLSKVPLAANPNGSPPNFDNPPSLGPATYGVVTTMICLSTVILGMRIFSNLKQTSKLLVDDYFCFFAWALTCAYGIVIMTMDETARHAWDTPISFINADWLKRNAALCLTYGPAMWCAKMAVFTLYLRLFGTVDWLRWSCWFCIGLSALVYGSMIPVYAVFNFPHGNERWGLSMTAKASKTNIQSIITTSFNVAFDIFLIALPLPIILGLNLSTRKKVGLSAVFLTGIIGLVGTILGLYYRVILNEPHGQADPTWYASATYLTVLVELFVTIMVSCVPGCVSSWKNILRDSAFVTTLRSLLSSSTASLSRVTTGSGRDKHHASDSSTNLHDVQQYELRPVPGSATGITKSVEIKQEDV